ncbi:hypothetical protein JCM19379_07680 [Methyloparacoccus murrellii]
MAGQEKAAGAWPGNRAIPAGLFLNRPMLATITTIPPDGDAPCPHRRNKPAPPTDRTRTMKYGALTLMLATSLLLSGCNTWSGFGQDLQKVGQKVQQQGDKVKH